MLKDTNFFNMSGSEDQSRERRDRSRSSESVRFLQRFKIMEGSVHAMQQKFAEFETNISATITSQIEKGFNEIWARLHPLPPDNEPFESNVEMTTTHESVTTPTPAAASFPGPAPLSSTNNNWLTVSKKKSLYIAKSQVDQGKTTNQNGTTTPRDMIDQSVSNNNNSFQILEGADDTGIAPSRSRNNPKRNLISTTANKKSQTATPIVAFKLNQKWLNNALTSKNRLDFKIAGSRNPDRCTILPESKETHMATLALLKEQNIKNYTFTPNGEKNTALLLKNIPLDYDLNDVIDEFKNLKLSDKIAKISPISKGRLAGFNFFVISVLPGVPIGEFLKLDLMLHSKVKIEKLINTDDPQCYKCQRSGHMANNCQMDPRCVKCAKEHTSKDCDIPKNSPKEMLLCAICGNPGHPANYRGCPKLKEMISNRKQAQRQTQVSKSRPSFTSVRVSSNLSYAATLNPGGNTTKTGKNSIADINNLLNSASEELFGCNYSTLKTQFDAFMGSLKSSDNPAIRKKALLNFISMTDYNGQ